MVVLRRSTKTGAAVFFGTMLMRSALADAVRYAVGVVGMFDCVRSPAFQRDIDLTCAAAAQISTALGYRA